MYLVSCEYFPRISWVFRNTFNMFHHWLWDCLDTVSASFSGCLSPIRSQKAFVVWLNVLFGCGLKCPWFIGVWSSNQDMLVSHRYYSCSCSEIILSLIVFETLWVVPGCLSCRSVSLSLAHGLFLVLVLSTGGQKPAVISASDWPLLASRWPERLWSLSRQQISSCCQSHRASPETSEGLLWHQRSVFMTFIPSCMCELYQHLLD